MRLGDYLKKYICEPCGVSDITYVSLSFHSSPSPLLPPFSSLSISLFYTQRTSTADYPHSFDLTPLQRSKLAGAHFRWSDGHITPRGKIMMDDVRDHLGGAGAFATARGFASVLLVLINEGRHRTSSPLLAFPAFPPSLIHPALHRNN